MSRLLEFIEKDPFAPIEKVLKEQCRPYIIETKASPNFLYRGVDELLTRYIIRKPRMDRRPTDTPVNVSNRVDDMFQKKFGWRPRSQGVFAVASPELASEYGRPYIFVPLGKYEYLWSPKVEDMYATLKKDLELEVEEFSYYIKTYKSTGLTQALLTDHEVMFKCGSYILIDYDYRDRVLEVFTSQ